jgi:hypothetical protein
VLLEYSEADEQYVNMMLRKTAMRPLTKHRKNQPPIKPPVLINPEIDNILSSIEIKMGITKSPIESIKNCRKCYFKSAFRMIGNDWYTLCTNVARASHMQRGKWVHCESNLSCRRSL